MDDFRRVTGHTLNIREIQYSAPSPILEQQGIAELRVGIGLLQQHLKKLDRDLLKTGSVSQETAHLIRTLDDTLLLCQSTYQKLEESLRRIVSFTVTDTLPQIHKALRTVSRFMPIDRLPEEAQTNNHKNCT